MRVERNALESDRFNVAFARLEDPSDGQLKPVLRTADNAGIDVISTRVNTSSLAVVRALEGCGFRIMDTLVYYRVDIATAASATVHPPLVRAASPADAYACARIAASAFHAYLGHYHADPRLGGDRADAAYVDWTTRLLCESTGDQIALCAHAGSVVVGFLVGVAREAGVGEIVLNAVDPAYQRQGCYHALLAAYFHLAARRGDTAAIISTQLQNYQVQRAWRRHGFQLFDSYHTLHRWRTECEEARS